MIKLLLTFLFLIFWTSSFCAIPAFGKFSVASDHASLEKSDRETSKLTLSGNVEIVQEGTGKLQAAEDVHLILNIVEGKKELHSIDTNGEAVLTYIDPETELEHILRSYGTLRIDHQKMEARLQGPRNEDGAVVDGKQVFFKDAKGEIRADRGMIKYDYAGQRMILVRIVLQGNVKLADVLEQTEGSQAKTNQYILADRVDFIPETKEMIFKADQGRRVLLFDKENHLEVSASMLKLFRDKATRKETVQGMGDVRFSFVDGELDQLRRHFSFDKTGSEVNK